MYRSRRRQERIIKKAGSPQKTTCRLLKQTWTKSRCLCLYKYLIYFYFILFPDRNFSFTSSMYSQWRRSLTFLSEYLLWVFRAQNSDSWNNTLPSSLVSSRVSTHFSKCLTFCIIRWTFLSLMLMESPCRQDGTLHSTLLRTTNVCSNYFFEC